MVAVRKAVLGARNGEERAHGSRRSKSAGVPTLVWYIYRRVPAVTLIKSLVDKAGSDGVSLSREVPAGLDDLDRPAAGRRRVMAPDASTPASGVTGDLLAHCIDTAMVA
jgi:hypothetical protein